MGGGGVGIDLSVDLGQAPELEHGHEPEPPGQYDQGGVVDGVGQLDHPRCTLGAGRDEVGTGQGVGERGQGADLSTSVTAPSGDGRRLSGQIDAPLAFGRAAGEHEREPGHRGRSQGITLGELACRPLQ